MKGKIIVIISAVLALATGAAASVFIKGKRADCKYS